MEQQNFRLISRTTTTGWMDFEHGELWLSSDGLLRRRRGWFETFASVGLIQDALANSADPLIERRFSDEMIDQILEQGGWWIPADAIGTARLRNGLTVGRVRLVLNEGDPAKFLWIKSRLTYDALRDALTGWVGDRLIFD